MTTSVVQEIYDGVLNGKSPIVQRKIQEALAAGVEPITILNEGMIAAMAEVGNLFECGEYFVPDMLLSARAMHAGLGLLKARLAEAQVQATGKVVVGTVKGDLHDIGKNLVSVMLEGAGFEIVDLGIDVPPEKFVEVVEAGGVDIIALSSLLTTTMASMKVTLEALEQAEVRDKVKVMVGGAPVTQEYAQRIGADGYSPDASQAVTLAKALVGRNERAYAGGQER